MDNGYLVRKSKDFWNQEYSRNQNFGSSRSWIPSREIYRLEKYLKENKISAKGWQILDLACGNGRNSIFMLQNWNIGKAIGIDFAGILLKHFKSKAGKEALLSKVEIYEQSIGKEFPIKNGSIDLVLDIYGSINLRADERINCRDETYGVLKKGRLLLTYLTSRDSGFVKKKIDCTKGPEPDSVIFNNGKFEKVFSEEEIRDFYKDFKLIELKKDNFDVGKYPVEMFWALLRR